MGTRLNFMTAFHPQTDGQSERTIQTLKDMLRMCIMDLGGSWNDHLPLVEFSYNNSYYNSIEMTPCETLYEIKCGFPLCWDEIGERELTGPEIIQDAAEKVALIKRRLETVASRQKSYADPKRGDVEFQVNVSPMKGVMKFGKKEKLAPRYIGPFDLLERIGMVA